ncbi:hypothetical protein ACA910_016875 [Epithemia clementina (nom. ined.)]
MDAYHSYHLLFVVTVLLGQLSTLVGGQCKLCTNGGTASYLSTGILQGDVTCQQLDSSIGFIPSDSAICEYWQMQAFMYCGCPTYPVSSFCSMCANNAFNIPSNTKFKRIPLKAIPSNQSVCVDSLFTRQSDLCQEYQRAAYYCGCPNAPAPICHAVCKPPSPDASTTEIPAANRLLPPYFNMTCQDMYLQLPFYWTDDECTALQDPAYSLIDESAYCCSNTMPQQPSLGTGCDLCSGGPVLNPARIVTVAVSGTNTEVKLSCKDLQALSYVVTDDAYCDSFFVQNPALGEACCLGLSDAPSQKPSTRPIGTPSEPPSQIPSEQPTKTKGEFSNVSDDPPSAATIQAFPLLIRARQHVYLSFAVGILVFIIS